MKRTFIVLSFMVAVCMLFAAAKVSADGTSASCTSSPNSRSFVCRGYRVETVPLSGDFPNIHQIGVDTKNNPVFESVFTYKITQIDRKANLVNWADILIPACAGNPSHSSCTTLSCSGNMFTGGSGDPFTGFGLGLTTDNTWKWDWTLSSKLKGVTGGTVSLTLPGKLYASEGTMLLKLSLLNFNYPFGQILAPSCSAISQVSSPSVPLTTQKEINFGDINVCFESPDQSSCPANIYSCLVSASPLVYADSPCNCLAPDTKQSWVEVDLGITAGSSNRSGQILILFVQLLFCILKAAHAVHVPSLGESRDAFHIIPNHHVVLHVLNNSRRLYVGRHFMSFGVYCDAAHLMFT